MEEYLKKLRAQLEEELSKIDPEGDAVKGYHKRAAVVKSYLEMLTSYLRENPFSDQTAEIYYFKHIAPFFYRDYYYLKKLYWLEVVKITSDEEAYKLFLVEELEKNKVFLKKKHRLHQYFYSQEDHQDAELFALKRSTTQKKKLTAGGSGYSCPASRRLGLIFTYVQYRDFCKMELREIESQTGGKRASLIKCDLNKTEAAEFVSFAYEVKLYSINGVPYNLEQLKQWVKEQWNIDLKYFKNVDKNSRDRKGAVPPLIKKMLAAYNIRKNRLKD